MRSAPDLNPPLRYPQQDVELLSVLTGFPQHALTAIPCGLVTVATGLPGSQPQPLAATGAELLTKVTLLPDCPQHAPASTLAVAFSMKSLFVVMINYSSLLSLILFASRTFWFLIETAHLSKGRKLVGITFQFAWQLASDW